MIDYSPLEKAWFTNEWRSACFILKKIAKKKGKDLSKIEIVKKGSEED